ncbi:MAG: virulence RhuM family protein [Fibrobacter sp.]|nr:virulence RhuM family protein [Fibrobacter sp.]
MSENDEKTGEIVLFERERSVIAKHIGNIFKEKELDEKSNVQILHNTLSKYKATTIYSLDVIISVGYRVKSLRGPQLRQWALNISPQTQ